MQVNGLSGAGSKPAGIKMAQKMDSFSINIKNEIARKQKEQQERNKMSRDNAEQLLNAAIQQEKNTNDKMKKAMRQPASRKLEKNW